MEAPIKMDELGGKPTIFGNIHMKVTIEVSWIHFESLGMFRWPVIPVVGTAFRPQWGDKNLMNITLQFL